MIARAPKEKATTRRMLPFESDRDAGMSDMMQ